MKTSKLNSSAVKTNHIIKTPCEISILSHIHVLPLSKIEREYTCALFLFQCSVTCGDGYSSRDVRCIIDERDQGSKSKDNTRRDAGPRESTSCVSSLRPDTRKLCSLVTCPLEPRYQRTDRYEPSTHGENRASLNFFIV